MAEKKTAQDKAKEALALADRKLARALAKRDAADKAYDEAQAEVKALTTERDYIASHPALQPIDIDPSPIGDGIDRKVTQAPQA